MGCSAMVEGKLPPPAALNWILAAPNLIHTCMHDIKLFARNIQKMVKILETVTMFSQDIEMTYQSIERGKRKAESKPLVVNNLSIVEIE